MLKDSIYSTMNSRSVMEIKPSVSSHTSTGGLKEHLETVVNFDTSTISNHLTVSAYQRFVRRPARLHDNTHDGRQRRQLSFYQRQRRRLSSSCRRSTASKQYLTGKSFTLATNISGRRMAHSRQLQKAAAQIKANCSVSGVVSATSSPSSCLSLSSSSSMHCDDTKRGRSQFLVKRQQHNRCSASSAVLSHSALISCSSSTLSSADVGQKDQQTLLGAAEQQTCARSRSSSTSSSCSSSSCLSLSSDSSCDGNWKRRNKSSRSTNATVSRKRRRCDISSKSSTVLPAPSISTSSRQEQAVSSSSASPVIPSSSGPAISSSMSTTPLQTSSMSKSICDKRKRRSTSPVIDETVACKRSRGDTCSPATLIPASSPLVPSHCGDSRKRRSASPKNNASFPQKRPRVISEEQLSPAVVSTVEPSCQRKLYSANLSSTLFSGCSRITDVFNDDYDEYTDDDDDMLHYRGDSGSLRTAIKNTATSGFRQHVQLHNTDPIYMGLPNGGMFCYQNAVLQVLFGVTPFVSECVAAAERLPELCVTVRSLAQLMRLRNMAQRHAAWMQLKTLRRQVFADIDPSFGNMFNMQDANEFMLRLFAAMQQELDIYGGFHMNNVNVTGGNCKLQQRLLDPVRSSFEYETLQMNQCCQCKRQRERREHHITWFTNVPRRRAECPLSSLRDALRLSMRPERREMRCAACGHDECSVTTSVCRLPRVLIVQLNRYLCGGGQLQKIDERVLIPSDLSLEEFATKDAASPVESQHERMSYNVGSYQSDASNSDTSNTTLEDLQLQEAIRMSLEQQSTTTEQDNGSDNKTNQSETLSPSAAGGRGQYRLMGVVSHYGRSAQSGHYVSDVYSMTRDQWLHYDDLRVKNIDKDRVLGETGQRCGYIFIYMHK